MPSEAESFLGITPRPSGAPPDPDAIGIGSRVFVVAITWFTALFVTCPDPRGIVILHLFPLGLQAFLLPKSTESLALLVFGWLLYGALCAVILFCSKRLWIFLFYAVLTALLITNVAGCREALYGHTSTH